MKNLAMLALIISLLTISGTAVYAQQPQLASYRETAHILVDNKIQNQTTAFITLASTSPVEMRVPPQLSDKIQKTANVTSVVITNADKCIIGIQDMGCVIIVINSPALIETYDIAKIQSTARKVGDTLIGEINKAFVLNAEFNNVYVNPKGELSNALGTSGVVSGNRTISVVYTMSRPDSAYLYDGLSSILMPKQIRDDGGFYNAAKKISQDSNSTVTFAITPAKEVSLYQLQVSKHTPIRTNVTSIKPLELLGVDKLERSNYYSVGFFPLNSILDVTIISNDNISIINHGGDLAPTTIKEGKKFPTDLTKPGWIIDPESGKSISAVYLFGKTNSVSDNQTLLTLGSAPADQSIQSHPTLNNTTTITTQPSNDYSVYALIGIVVAGGAAIYLFMRKR
jgi:hypothetical protein